MKSLQEISRRLYIYLYSTKIFTLLIGIICKVTCLPGRCVRTCFVPFAGIVWDDAGGPR